MRHLAIVLDTYHIYEWKKNTHGDKPGEGAWPAIIGQSFTSNRTFPVPTDKVPEAVEGGRKRIISEIAHACHKTVLGHRKGEYCMLNPQNRAYDIYMLSALTMQLIPLGLYLPEDVLITYPHDVMHVKDDLEALRPRRPEHQSFDYVTMKNYDNEQMGQQMPKCSLTLDSIGRILLDVCTLPIEHLLKRIDRIVNDEQTPNKVVNDIRTSDEAITQPSPRLPSPAGSRRRSR